MYMQAIYMYTVCAGNFHMYSNYDNTSTDIHYESLIMTEQQQPKASPLHVILQTEDPAVYWR